MPKKKNTPPTTNKSHYDYIGMDGLSTKKTASNKTSSMSAAEAKMLRKKLQDAATVKTFAQFDVVLKTKM
jgi:hypothetical protein